MRLAETEEPAYAHLEAASDLKAATATESATQTTKARIAAAETVAVTTVAHARVEDVGQFVQLAHSAHAGTTRAVGAARAAVTTAALTTEEVVEAVGTVGAKSVAAVDDVDVDVRLILDFTHF